MPIEGFIDYKRREYCNDVKCSIQMLLNKEEEGSKTYEEIRSICKSNCLHTTRDFHYWLIEKGFEIVRPEKE
jgi:hypothetical protein